MDQEGEEGATGGKGVFEYVIDEHGLTIKDRLEGVTGVLGWSALRMQG
jgi:hypothetical protein